jgi:hypothetical protein
MSDINLDFTVNNNSINFTVEPNDITITPTDIQLNLSTAGLAAPGAPLNSVQYNKDSEFAGDGTFAYIEGTQTLGVQNLVLNGTAYINNANRLNMAVANLKISGGTNGYVLQTDGSGNLDWAAMSGGGNGTPGGSNTQIQYNDNGVFGGIAGFTFNEVSGNVAIPGNLSVAGNIIANYFIGNAGNSNYAAFAGNVVNSAQPNITSTGTLVSLNVTGNIVGNSYLGALGNVLYGIESISIIGAQTGTYNMDLINNAIKYSTANATSNLTLNFRGNSTVTLNSLIASSQSITSTYVIKNGATPYGISNVQIDGTSQTIKWVNGLIPITLANSSASYTFTLIKTSNTPTYDVLGSATRYI